MIKIFTDTGADYPYEVNNIRKIPLFYYFEDNMNMQYGLDNHLSNKDFFCELKKGRVPRTASANIEITKDLFREELDKNNDIICISVTSGLSSCYNNELIAAMELKEEYPDRRIEVIDSKIGSLPQALLAIKANTLVGGDYGFDNTIQFIENNKLLYDYEIVLEDLIYPVRGGRVNAVLGNSLNKLKIKPLIRVDKNGKAVVNGMVRGTKKIEDRLINDALDLGVDNVLELGIVHSDNLERAIEFKEKILGMGIVEDVPIAEIGPAVGSYTGPNSLGLVTKRRVRRK